ncbi:RNA-guided pseudouridylation complex pseudouridine synthase subunit Cbf5 [Methanococcus voltae]|jgi:H/ACA ribonucleoprotein complex subunit 4|uniref:Probable tRNA pseudouridine synthase B n=2 Tax=Methanococcus voltae TaxID=2188 RepID=A0A8J7RGV3_METVO|nr:RNA-guided pseudouridylation complex pseudouridine synthase subunit Cbf5 [Methanococcus voltae]MBP2172348.1 H/ACA ribonucleoprotein complex subunit 4 [Methanococcus voltae]MBP2200696.1 H/ACA ribonucleoprotein complex subunit 4 [Methanococcus voltae]MCS3921421.1 H/ACA ribonucleoprotein complex subunit 4 [Methanococcus voltae PS]
MSMEREMLIKEESKTNYEFGTNPYNRDIKSLLETGIVIINKPSGPTSHEVSAWVRDILRVSKAGHGGTLDPKVTGALPIALGNSTKCVPYWHIPPKEYVCIMRLHRDMKESKIGEKEILELFDNFIGKMYQRPPLKASVARKLRVRKIYELKLIEINEEINSVLFWVRCQSGTYLRKLVDDFGEALGVSAHMQELRRVKSGPFFEEEAIYLQDLVDEYIYWKGTGDEQYIREIIKPVEYGLQHMPKVVIKDSAVNAICHGADLYANGITKIEKGIGPEELVLLETLKGEAVAIGKTLANTKKILKSDEEMVIDIERVIMDKNIYPKMWKSSKKKKF